MTATLYTKTGSPIHTQLVEDYFDCGYTAFQGALWRVESCKWIDTGFWRWRLARVDQVAYA